MKKYCYISGPIEHHDIIERMSIFKFTENKVRTLGYIPINPFNNGVNQSAGWRDHMRIDIRMLTHCDCIYMMKDWLSSKGCKLELDVASSCGLEVIFE